MAVAAAVAVVGVAAGVGLASDSWPSGAGAVDPGQEAATSPSQPSEAPSAEPSAGTASEPVTPEQASTSAPSAPAEPGVDVSTASSVPGPPPEVLEAGLRDASVLQASDSIVVSEDGEVVENLDVAGNIKVMADDVTIRNVRVRSSSDAYGIDVTKGHHGTVIEDVEVEVGLNNTSANAAIGGIGDHQGSAGTSAGSNVVVRRSYLHGSGDGIKAANYGLYEGNRIEMRRGDGSVKHIDGIQASGSSGWTARRNLIVEPYSSGHNSAIFAQPYTGKRDTSISNIRIEDNWVNGGTYTIQLGKAKNGEEGLVSDVTIDGNVFYGDFKYGAFLPRGSGVSGDGGVWADTGEIVPTGKVSDD